MENRPRHPEEAIGSPDRGHLTIRRFHADDEEAVVSLWQQCGLTRPWNDSHRDIARALGVQPDLFILAVLDGQVVGSTMAGYDGHRGWIHYLAVAPEHRGAGYARRLMAEAESRLLALGCPKINLQVRCGNRPVIGFYQRLGYVQDDVVSFGKRLISDEDTTQ